MDERDEKGETALFRAVNRKDIQTVRELLAAGANPDVPDERGWRAIHQVDIFDVLLLIFLLIQAGVEQRRFRAREYFD
jgi:ankyrin repeat protein